ncbi:13E12 repeat family protein [Marivita sp. S6314]|uniref:DUF6455 family protein n=1 Tax=Marivita sp. S6314 TaxID=2926406 RepID=UPI001FF38F65|nr:DUF6455 family protein [Marivita sp. S6314]MCK0150098.1 13E12 repeat family protein [Marivita sp. S6314]
MHTESKRAHHTKLVLDMADQQGVDLAELFMRAELTEDQLDNAVDRCVGCTNPNACRSLLDSAAHPVDLPDYCRNGDLFRSLKA